MNAPMAEPKLTVVMATYNRAETLRETLACLRAQDVPPGTFELIVVDDGSPDHTPAVVEEFRASCPFPLTFLRHANRGPGFTQNRGMREARAPLVMLMADDIFLAPGAIRAHIECHGRHPQPGTAILGRVLQSPKLDETVFLSKWDPWHLGELADDTPLPYHMFWACNISFKREFMLAHGMFRDEMGRAGAAAHEDAELGHRLHAHGLRIYSGREAMGWHHHVETLEGTLKRSFQRGLNFHDFRKRVPHPEIAVTYRDYDLGFLLSEARALRGPRREYLLEGDRSLARLAVRHVARTVLFNRVTVAAFWRPLFALAERSRLVAGLVREGMYRGAVVHYFLRGCREGDRRFGGVPQSQPQS